MSLTTILLGLLVFNVLIIAHEVGHLLAARSVGMDVIEFSIGIGPRVFGFTARGTDFVWRLLPLGGFVLIPDLGGEEGALPVPPWRRMVALLGGPLFNMLVAVLIMGPRNTVVFSGHWFQALAGLFRSGESGTELSGIVGITEAAGEAAASYGFLGIMIFTGMLSLNVGLFNLLPIPGLDGGQLLGLLIEKLNGGRRPRWQPTAQAIGLLAMVGLTLCVTGLEILRRLGWM